MPWDRLWLLTNCFDSKISSRKLSTCKTYWNICRIRVTCSVRISLYHAERSPGHFCRVASWAAQNAQKKNAYDAKGLKTVIDYCTFTNSPLVHTDMPLCTEYACLLLICLQYEIQSLEVSQKLFDNLKNLLDNFVVLASRFYYHFYDMDSCCSVKCSLTNVRVTFAPLYICIYARVYCCVTTLWFTVVIIPYFWLGVSVRSSIAYHCGVRDAPSSSESSQRPLAPW